MSSFGYAEPVPPAQSPTSQSLLFAGAALHSLLPCEKFVVSRLPIGSVPVGAESRLIQSFGGASVLDVDEFANPSKKLPSTSKPPRVWLPVVFAKARRLPHGNSEATSTSTVMVARPSRDTRGWVKLRTIGHPCQF